MSNIDFDNLLLLRNHLSDNVKDEHFDISLFRSTGDNLVMTLGQYDEHQCGSIGCSVGQGIYVEGLEPSLDVYSESDDSEQPNCNSYIDWEGYCLETYGFGFERKLNGLYYDYLFSDNWEHMRPSREQAINRLDFIIKNKRVPISFNKGWYDNHDVWTDGEIYNGEEDE